MKRRSRPLLLAALPMLAILICSCSTGKAARQSIDPIAVLSYSSGGLEPAAFAVLPPDFVLPALGELMDGASGGDGAAAVSFLNEFFARADCVFASIMCDSDTGALFCRILAFGKFPASAKMLLTSSRGWQKKEADGALWFESVAFAAGRAMRVAIPASGALLAEIDIAPPSSKGDAGAASSSMADFVAAATSSSLAAQALPAGFGHGDSGEGAAFFSSLDAALSGAANAPFAFYAPDFNLLMRSVLPAVPGFPLAGAVAALSAFEGFSLPISSIELTVDKGRLEPAEGEAPVELLAVRVAVPSKPLTRAAAAIVQLIFPDDDVAAEDGAIVATKELPSGSTALAVLSFFLLS